MDETIRNFLKPETRDGEFLDEKKKMLYKVSIDILKEIERICDKHGLRYFAAYGTLLGAVRHKGFIPWDDDMDLWMPRPDYEKFQQFAVSELPEYYFLQTTLTERAFPEDMLKIRDSRTTCITEWDVRSDRRINLGIWVSIFPLDGFPPTCTATLPVLFGRKIITAMMGWATRRKCLCLTGVVKRMICKPIVFLLGVKKLCRWRSWMAHRYPFDASRKCTSLWCTYGYYEFDCHRRAFDECEDVPFEYTTIRVPKDYETPLRALYGDWRVPVKGVGDHTTVDLEPTIPYKHFLLEKYGIKISD